MPSSRYFHSLGAEAAKPDKRTVARGFPGSWANLHGCLVTLVPTAASLPVGSRSLQRRPRGRCGPHGDGHDVFLDCDPRLGRPRNATNPRRLRPLCEESQWSLWPTRNQHKHTRPNKKHATVKPKNRQGFQKKKTTRKNHVRVVRNAPCPRHAIGVGFDLCTPTRSPPTTNPPPPNRPPINLHSIPPCPTSRPMPACQQYHHAAAPTNCKDSLQGTSMVLQITTATTTTPPTHEATTPATLKVQLVVQWRPRASPLISMGRASSGKATPVGAAHFVECPCWFMLCSSKRLQCSCCFFRFEENLGTTQSCACCFLVAFCGPKCPVQRTPDSSLRLRLRSSGRQKEQQ